MKWTADFVRYVQKVAYETDVTSLNATIRNGENDEFTEVGDLLENKDDQFDELNRQDTRESLLRLINKLNDARQQKVLILRFGLEDGVYRTLDEIGERYGVTRERIRQIELKALAKLKSIVQKQNITYYDF